MTTWFNMHIHLLLLLKCTGLLALLQDYLQSNIRPLSAKICMEGLTQLLAYGIISLFCQLSVGGWSQATYQILIDVLRVHKQPKAIALMITWVNRQTNSRQRTCHQPTGRRSSWSSSTRRNPD